MDGGAYKIIDSSSYTANQWLHVTFTYGGSGSMNVYVNASLDNASTLTSGTVSDITSTEIFQIGRHGSTSTYVWDGYIKELAIFSAELSASDVTALYNSGLPKDLSSESDLLAYWRMGDGEDKYPNILDYKGTAHGTMTNMAADDITTANIGSGAMTNMTSDDIVADSPAGTSGQMTNMASDDFVAAKGAGTMTNMTAEDIVADVPS